MNFDYNTFNFEGLNKNNDQVGTVKGVFSGEQITCRAYKGSNGELTLAGFMGQYSANEQLWIATVWLNKSNKLKFYFGCEDRPGRNKESNLVFNPDQYFEQAPLHLFTVVTKLNFYSNVCPRCGDDSDEDECHSCELEFAQKYNY